MYSGKTSDSPNFECIYKGKWVNKCSANREILPYLKVRKTCDSAFHKENIALMRDVNKYRSRMLQGHKTHKSGRNMFHPSDSYSQAYHIRYCESIAL